MKNRSAAVCLSVFLTLAGSASVFAQTAMQEQGTTMVRLGPIDSELVRIEQRADGSTVYKRPARDTGERRLLVPPEEVRIVVRPELVVELVPGTDARALATELGTPLLEMRTYAARRFVILDATTGAAATLMCRALEKDTRVLSAETLIEGVNAPFGTVPTDTRLPDQWHHRNTGQTAGAPGNDANVFPAWMLGYSGVGSTILIVDNGVQTGHPDIAPNYNAAGSWDVDQGVVDPNPKASGEYHGTACAGMAAASDDGSNCVGAAYNAEISGFRVDFPTSTDLDFATAQTWAMGVNEITSNSYGPRDSLLLNAPLRSIMRGAIEDGIANGRGGLGTIYVKSGGNGRAFGDDSNFDGFAGSRYTISVCATDHNGLQASYSESGANHLVNAPSSSDGAPGTTTSDVENIPGVGNGYTSGSFTTDSFGGTSSACPLVAGVVALMLEANPNLGWRDVQQILARTAVRNDPSHPEWTINASGLWHNQRYGFGRVDAEAAVLLAQTWTNVGPELTELHTFDIPTPIPFSQNPGEAIEVALDVQDSSIDKIETIEFRVDFDHTWQGDMRITLISPDGVSSVVKERPGDGAAGYSVRFTTVRHMDDNPNGTWRLRFEDTFPDADTGQLRAANIRFYGVEEDTPITDCNNNGTNDLVDIANDPSLDCNSNGALDSCEITDNASLDLDSNGALDACEITSDPSLDCDGNGVLDSVEITQSAFFDCDNDGVYDACQIAGDAALDVNGNGFIDACEPGVLSDAAGVIHETAFTTVRGGNDFGAYCGVQALGEDYAVELELTVPNAFTLTLDSDLGAQSVVSIRDTPNLSGNCLAVNADPIATKVLTSGVLSPGTYYIFVDAIAGAGDFDLLVEFAQPGPMPCPADFTGDGAVDLGDFGIFGAAFGSVPGDSSWDPRADLDTDGDVDLGDFGLFGGAFGRIDCPAMAPAHALRDM